MNTRPKNPANARNLNALCDRFVRLQQNPVLAYPQILQASADKNGGCSYVCVDPKGRRSWAGGPLPAKAWVSDQGVQFH